LFDARFGGRVGEIEFLVGEFARKGGGGRDRGPRRIEQQVPAIGGNKLKPQEGRRGISLRG